MRVLFGLIFLFGGLILFLFNYIGSHWDHSSQIGIEQILILLDASISSTLSVFLLFVYTRNFTREDRKNFILIFKSIAVITGVLIFYEIYSFFMPSDVIVPHDYWVMSAVFLLAGILMSFIGYGLAKSTEPK